MEGLLSSLDHLRSLGAQRFDPVRFRYLEVLAKRWQAATGEVQPLLAAKLTPALAAFQERFTQAQQAARDEMIRQSARHPEQSRELRRLWAAGDFRGLHKLGLQASADRPVPPLALLNQHIQRVTQDDMDLTGLGLDLGHDDAGARADMKSVRRFREAWSMQAADDQVVEAVERGPENAGPLNSHMLVLRSLALMRDLSPAYLRRFLSQVDTLLWLDQVNEKHALVEAKPARRGRSKK